MTGGAISIQNRALSAYPRPRHSHNFFPPDRIVKRNGKMTAKPSARLILKIRASDRAMMAAATHFYSES